MVEAFNDFHFLRPWLLLALVPACLLLWLLQRQSRSTTSWQDVIAPELLRHLLSGSLSKQQRLPFWGIGCAWMIATVALAGPTWQKLPQPVHKTESAMVILLDLSPSMLAQDLKPSRLVRARHKLTDLLQQRREGITALVAYAGEAHVVTPLTDDTRTIISLLPALHPGVMPLSGSNTEMAVDVALQLFADAGINRGQLLLVTDGVEPRAQSAVEQRLRNSRFNLSVMSVGTDAGAPIPLGNGGFARDRQGGIVVARVRSEQLRDLAESLGGAYTPLLPSEADIQRLAQLPMPADDNTRRLQREFDTWEDLGAWLALLLLPLVALSFRRGWLLAVVAVLPLVQAPPAAAGVWDDLWQRRDQQGQQSLQQGDAATAARQFRDHRWCGSAHYRSGDYTAAAEAFAEGGEAVDDYNRGNALAQAGQLDQALQAYSDALDKDPQLQSARRNAEIVEALRNQQQQQQSEQQSSQQPNQQSGQQQNQNQAGDQQQAGDGNPQGQDGQPPQDPGRPGEDPPQQRDQSAAAPDGGAEQQPADRQAQDSQQAQSGDPGDDSETGAHTAQRSQAGENTEQQQALEQWLRQIPDDPSGLLRQKFQHQYRERRKAYRAGTWEPPQNEANKRW